ncbi:MAG TPA: ParA family protein, partial [Acidimicrobiales bacterium]|nr:ParA family protein [Acidimicrobiales bacterium]
MSTPRYTAVVVGLPTLAQALEGRMVIDRVVVVDDERSIETALGADVSLAGTELLFVFSAEHAGLAHLLSRHYHVAVVGTGDPQPDAAVPTVAVPPTATVNDALAALGAVEGFPFLLPVDPDAPLFGPLPAAPAAAAGAVAAPEMPVPAAPPAAETAPTATEAPAQAGPDADAPVPPEWVRDWAQADAPATGPQAPAAAPWEEPAAANGAAPGLPDDLIDMLAVADQSLDDEDFEGWQEPTWRRVTNARKFGVEIRRRKANEPVKVIAFTVPKGGTGKTSISAYGSIVLGRAGKRVLYVDANAQQADGIELLAANHVDASTIFDLANKEVTTEAVQSVITPINSHVHALFGPRDPTQANPLVVTPQLYCQAVDAVRDLYDYVIVDGPIAEVFRDLIDQFVLRIADFIAVIVTPSRPALNNTFKWLNATTNVAWAGQWTYPADQVGFVLNRFEDDIAIDEDAAMVALEKWRYLGKIPDLRSVRRAANLGEVPDDPEFLSAVAGVLLQITADQALEALAAGPARGGRSGIFRRRG